MPHTKIILEPTADWSTAVNADSNNMTRELLLPKGDRLTKIPAEGNKLKAQYGQRATVATGFEF